MNRSLLQLIVIFTVLLSASGLILIYRLHSGRASDSIYLSPFRLRPGYHLIPTPPRKKSCPRPDRAELDQMVENALSAIENDRIDLAEDQVRTVLVFDPDNRMALIIFGRILYGRNRFPEAEEIFRRQVRLNPDDSAALNNLGSALARQNKLTEAFNYLERAWRKDPQSPEIIINFAGLQAMLGNRQAALEMLRRAEKLLGPALLGLAGDPSFDTLRDTPEFRSLLRRAAAAPLPGLTPLRQRDTTP